MMKFARLLAGILVVLFALHQCGSGDGKETASGKKEKKEYVKKYREDGTLKSITGVDEEGYADGVKVNYYDDGKNIHSKVSYKKGVKQGPAIWYYKNGKPFEHTNFNQGKRDGLTKKYYKSGKLLAVIHYKNGVVQPGLKEYKEDGTLITDYPRVIFNQVRKNPFENEAELEITTTDPDRNTKYFYLLEVNDSTRVRSYLESSRGTANLEFNLFRGNDRTRKIEIYAEIPTKLGNYLIKKATYQVH